MGNKTGKIVRKEIRFPDENDRAKLAFTLSNVFSPDECQEWITMAEETDFVPALLNVGGASEALSTKYRDSGRCIIDSPKLAQKLFLRLEPFLPRTWNDGEFELVGLNERLRFLCFDPGQKFQLHKDGAYRRQDGSGEESFITVQLYLNEGYKGGEITFLSIDNPKNKVSFSKKTGKVLIFEHRVLHERSAVRKGRQYTMRTDVMYRPVNHFEFNSRSYRRIQEK